MYAAYSRDNVFKDIGTTRQLFIDDDSVRQHVKWSGRDHVKELPGGVRLRFYLRNAELYGFQFADS